MRLAQLLCINPVELNLVRFVHAQLLYVQLNCLFFKISSHKKHICSELHNFSLSHASTNRIYTNYLSHLSQGN